MLVVWLGVRPETGEHLIGTVDGVIKCRSMRSKPDRFGKSDVVGIKGVPWEVVFG